MPKIKQSLDFDTVATPMREPLWKAQSLCAVAREYVRAQEDFAETNEGVHLGLTIETIGDLLDGALGELEKLGERCVIVVRGAA